MKKRLFGMLVLGLMLLLAACGGGGEADPAGNGDAAGETPAETPVEAQTQPETVRFTDTAGTEHEMKLPLEKVIVMNRNTAEAIKVLGAEDAVIATGDTTIANNPYLGFAGLPDVGKTGEVNIELLLSLKPQAVFAYTNRPDSVLEEKLEPAGIKVIRMNNYLPDQMDQEWKLLGKLFQKEAQAEAFLTWKHDIEKLLADRVKGIEENEKKRVMALSVGFLNSNGGYRIFPSESVGGEPGVGEGYATILAGGKDAADLQWNPAEASTTIMVDEEYVLARDPDVITLHGTWLGGYDVADDAEHKAVIDNILKISSVPQLTAGKNKELYIFHTNFIGSDKRYIGVLQLAKYLYPERFADLEPEKYMREYFESWLGVPYQGVWYYSAKAQP